MVRLIVLLLFASPCFAAGGTCPSGIPVSGSNCYFVSASGVDTNTGTDEAHPWLHAPGMPNCANTCASVQSTIDTTTGGTGIGIILHGGDTWHFGNSGATPYTGGTWTFNAGGTPSTCLSDIASSGCMYYGVDQTWYNSGVCGSSWCRPILSGDNPTTGFGTSQFASSCAYQVTGGNNTLTTTGGNRTNIFLDGFEMTGMCSSRISGATSDDNYLGDRGNW